MERYHKHHPSQLVKRDVTITGIHVVCEDDTSEVLSPNCDLKKKNQNNNNKLKPTETLPNSSQNGHRLQKRVWEIVMTERNGSDMITKCRCCTKY